MKEKAKRILIIGIIIGIFVWIAFNDFENRSIKEIPQDYELFNGGDRHIWR